MEYTLGEILVAAKLQDDKEWGRDALISVHLLMRAVEYMQANDRLYQVQREIRHREVEAPEIPQRKLRVMDADALMTCVLVAE